MTGVTAQDADGRRAMEEQAATIEQQLRRNAALYFPNALGKVTPKHVAKEASAYARATVARGTPLRAKFVIMTRGRAGSGLLVDLLNSHPQIRCQTELLHDRMLFPRRYLRANERLARLPVFGFKLLSYQMIGVQKLASPAGFLHELAGDGYSVIYLWRRNLLRQILSLLYAAERRSFHSHAGDDVAHTTIRVDPAIVLSWLEFSTRLGEWERSVLAELPYVDVTYEDDLSRSEAQQATVARITTRLGLEPAPVQSTLTPSTPRALDDFVANADELRRSLAGTPYAQYLDAPHAG